MRAALDERAARDIVTTRTGKFTVALTRYLPGRLVDHVILRQIRKGMRRQDAHALPGPVGDFASRIG